MRKTILSLMIVALATTGAAFAGGPANEWNVPDAYSGNSTKELAVENVKELGAANAFARLDESGDGSVSKMEAGRMEGLERIFAELDADGNGKLNFAEFAAVLSSAAAVASVEAES